MIISISHIRQDSTAVTQRQQVYHGHPGPRPTLIYHWNPILIYDGHPGPRPTRNPSFLFLLNSLQPSNQTFLCRTSRVQVHLSKQGVYFMPGPQTGQSLFLQPGHPGSGSTLVSYICSHIQLYLLFYSRTSRVWVHPYLPNIVFNIMSLLLQPGHPGSGPTSVCYINLLMKLYLHLYSPDIPGLGPPLSHQHIV